MAEEYIDKNGDRHVKTAGGHWINASERDRHTARGIKNIAWFFRILFGKPKTRGQKGLKVFMWVLTISVLLLVGLAVILPELAK
jgi:hypothetical protein